MDFRVRTAGLSYGVRASGLLVRDHHIFLLRSAKGEYYLPGGAILVGERTEEAIRREMLEELGMVVKVDSLAFVVENQFAFEDELVHQIEFLYLLSSQDEPRVNVDEGLSGRTGGWVPVAELSDLDHLNPVFLKTELANWDGQLKHFSSQDK